MDFSRFHERLPEFLRNAQLNAQTVAALALAVIVLVALVTAVQNSTSSSYGVLFESARNVETRRDEIEATLGKAGLPYRFEEGRLVVPSGERAKYFVALHEAGLLRKSFEFPEEQGLAAASIFEPPGLAKQRALHALESQAAFAIESIAGVEDAFVSLDQMEVRGLGQRQQMTGAVFVVTAPDQTLDLSDYRLIQQSLLGIKAGLRVEDITVTDLTAAESIRGSIDDLDPMELQAFSQRQLQRQWRQQLSSALSYLADARINVRVVPNDTRTAAERVHVSVGVSSNYVRRLGGLSQHERIPDTLVQQTRQQIEATLQPMLPATDSPTEQVAVHLIQTGQPKIPPPRRLVSTSTISAVLMVLVALGGALLLVSSSRPTAVTSEPHLRLYDSDSTRQDDEVSAESEEPAAILRAYVEQDPEAAAQTLSDFIDRAS